MNNTSKIINWEKVFEQSENFKNQKPFRFGFVEEVINKEFYEKLYETYPKIDESWAKINKFSKSQFGLGWADYGAGVVGLKRDPKFSDAWNEFYQYILSKDFVENIRKFSGIEVNKTKRFRFISYKKGGFQAPHIHNDGPNTLILFFYFSKGWEKGDPGGTYMATETDESSIIFEPYNLDNTMAIMHDGPNSVHGTRYITKNVERRAIQIYLEKFTEKNGWSGDKNIEEKKFD